MLVGRLRRSIYAIVHVDQGGASTGRGRRRRSSTPRARRSRAGTPPTRRSGWPRRLVSRAGCAWLASAALVTGAIGARGGDRRCRGSTCARTCGRTSPAGWGLGRRGLRAAARRSRWSSTTSATMSASARRPPQRARSDELRLLLDARSPSRWPPASWCRAGSLLIAGAGVAVLRAPVGEGRGRLPDPVHPRAPCSGSAAGIGLRRRLDPDRTQLRVDCAAPAAPDSPARRDQPKPALLPGVARRGLRGRRVGRRAARGRAGRRPRARRQRDRARRGRQRARGGAARRPRTSAR